MIKSRRIRSAGHVTLMEERQTHTKFAWKTWRNGSLGRLRSKV